MFFRKQKKLHNIFFVFNKRGKEMRKNTEKIVPHFYYSKARKIRGTKGKICVYRIVEVLFCVENG